MMCVLHSNFKHYTTVHDSFGTSLGDARELKEVIRKELYTLYVEYKPLDAFIEYAESVLGRPLNIKVPEIGSLDLRQILESEFVFH